MKKVGILVVFLIISALACSSGSGDKLKSGTPEYEFAKALSEKIPYLSPDKNNVLVKTDNFELRVGEFVSEIMTALGKRAEGLKALPADRLKNNIKWMANRLAEQKLLLAAAEKAGVEVTDAQIDSILQIQYKSSGGEDKFLQRVESMGVSMDFVRRDIAKNLKINLFLDKELAKQFEVTDAEIEDYYNKGKKATVQHILLNTRGKSDSAKKEIHKKMEKILEEAKSGADFGELAKKYSEDPGSKDRGGIYENFERGAMVAPFDSAAFTVPIGGISGIIETRFGYHILKVLDRKKDEKPLSEVHDQIKDKMTQERKKNAINSFIEKIKKDAHFEAVEF